MYTGLCVLPYSFKAGMPMRLFTSSSKNFIVKSLLLFVGMAVLYAVLVVTVKPKSTFVQNQYQGNFIFAQGFVYLEKKPSKLIVGSSMATRMKFTKEDGVYNLAFDGGGPLTGLEIVRRSRFVPKVIYIESNVFSMDVDEKFLDKLFTPVLFELRGKIIALQEKYQVLNLVGSFIYRFAGRSQKEKLQQKVDKALLDKLVSSTLQSSEKFHVDKAVLEKWHQNIDYFRQQGTELLFFEMPNDSRVVNTKGRRSLRTLIKEEFPTIPYIEEYNMKDVYQTRDGTHLTWKSAIAFTEYFRTHILNSKY